MGVLYEFEDVKTGEGVEEMLHPDEAPRIGETMRLNGRLLRRVASLPQTMIEPDFTHTTHQFSDADCARYGPRDRDGKPRKLTETGGLTLTSREANDMQARMTAAGKSMGYDRGQFRNKKRKREA